MDCPICTHPERALLEEIDFHHAAFLLTTMPEDPALASRMALEHDEVMAHGGLPVVDGPGLRHTPPPELF